MRANCPMSAQRRWGGFVESGNTGLKGALWWRMPLLIAGLWAVFASR